MQNRYIYEKCGKGVIYRMIDEYGNDCPYDFKSIMFKNQNDETDDKYYYTFGYECHNNIIKYYKQGNTLYIPNNTFGDSCYNNTFGHDCYNNSFGNYCHNNTFGHDCYNNTFGYGCNYNTFGSYYYNNTLDNNCHYNTFGIGCYNNRIGNKCTNNIFGNNCNYIQMINNNENGSGSKYVSYYNITSGTSGESYNPLIITGELNRNFETKVARNSNGDIKIYCEADLIA